MSQRIDPIRAVAFDLDGTLVDSAPDIAAAVNAMLGGLGYASLPQRRIESMIGDGVDRLVARALDEAAGSHAQGDATHAIDAFRSHYARHLFERSRLYPGVPEGLRELAAGGIALCVVTNKASAFARPLLGAAGIADMFELVLCADRPEDRKPSPNLLIAAAAQLEVPPQELLYVGDSRVDVAAARAAGCPVVVVDYGYDSPSAVDDAGHSVGSLCEIVALSVPRRVTC